ncbi:uncharacterized protein PV09_07804 [Verruconis gallopava]|uniref:Uncharacterized protein n=1 Tax=Verruconis gallopava TaxID=253628 RepID=A0A0D1YID7_9PEZI|nr:uncharacterized protein PV09_07804 [Verruconis gallopava]KIW00607.1 hypothetical protein PV09_07804 [Verruconis gallopava]
MGVSFSNLVEPQSQSQLQFSAISQRNQSFLPLYPGGSKDRLQIVPTCDHDTMCNHRDKMIPRAMLPGYGFIGGGFCPQRRSRFGHDIWDGGSEYGLSRRRPDTICGYCGDRAHQGPCRTTVGDERSGGWRRSQNMRGMEGHTDSGGDIAAGLNNLSAALREGIAAGGGCGPTCSANDGGIRVKGTVGDHDVDLKLGGKARCPCDEEGGCEHSHKKAKSSKRKDKRGRRRARRQEPDSDVDSTDGEQSRGRRRTPVPLRGGGGSPSGLHTRVEQLEADVKRLSNHWGWVRSRVPGTPPPFQARRDLNLRDETPFDLPVYGFEGPDLGGPATRRRRMGNLRHVSDIDELRLPPRRGLTRIPTRFGGIPNRAVDTDVESLFEDDENGAFSVGLGPQRHRPQMDKEDDRRAGEVGGFEDIEEDLPVRFHRSMGIRASRRLRGRHRGVPGWRGMVRTARDEAERRREEEMFGGLRARGESDEANWEC